MWNVFCLAFFLEVSTVICKASTTSRPLLVSIHTVRPHHQNFKTKPVNSVKLKNDDTAAATLPQFVSEPSSYTEIIAVPVGAKVKVHCRAKGHQPLRVQWFKNDVMLHGGRHKRCRKCKRTASSNNVIFKHKGFNLILRSVQVEDSGFYSCRVWNDFGEIHRQFTVRVVQRFRSSPIISPGYPRNVSVAAGEDAKFECPVYSDLVPIVVWLRHKCSHGRCKENVEASTLENAEEINELSGPPTLLIKNVSLQDAGTYTCVAGNSIGVSHRSAHLEVYTPKQELVVKWHNVKEDIYDKDRDSRFDTLWIGIAGLLGLLCMLSLLLYLIANSRRNRTDIAKCRGQSQSMNSSILPTIKSRSNRKSSDYSANYSCLLAESQGSVKPSSRIVRGNNSQNALI